MKKKWLLAPMAAALFLVGCGEEKEGTTTVNADTKNTEVKPKESKTESKEVKGGILLEEGQWTTEDNGTKVTLSKIVHPEKTIDLNPIKLTINTVKLFERTNIDQATKDRMKDSFNKELTDKFNVIQISYTVENTSDKEIMFFAIDALTTNTKVQMKGMDNLVNNTDSSQFVGKVEVEGTYAFPYFKESFDDLDTLNLLTGAPFDSNVGTDIHKAVKEQIDLK